MLDIGWAELLMMGVVALLVVGPKELPALARTIGKYAGMLRRQAAEFRSQFDEAIADTEFEDIKKEFDNIKSGAKDAVSEMEASANVSSADWEGPTKAPYTPNYTEEELDWLPQEGSAAKAAAAAVAGRAAGTTALAAPAAAASSATAGTASASAAAAAAAAQAVMTSGAKAANGATPPTAAAQPAEDEDADSDLIDDPGAVADDEEDEAVAPSSNSNARPEAIAS